MMILIFQNYGNFGALKNLCMSFFLLMASMQSKLFGLSIELKLSVGVSCYFAFGFCVCWNLIFCCCVMEDFICFRHHQREAHRFLLKLFKLVFIIFSVRVSSASFRHLYNCMCVCVCCAGCMQFLTKSLSIEMKYSFTLIPAIWLNGKLSEREKHAIL